MPENGSRSFSRSEAEALLPELDRLLTRAQELVEQVAEPDETTTESPWEPRRNGHARPDGVDVATRDARESAARELREVLVQIREMGVILRDVRSGLIDFPSQRDGRTIYLCWRRGEPLFLAWWHAIDSGFSSRQPLD